MPRATNQYPFEWKTFLFLVLTLACISGGIAHAHFGTIPEGLGDAALATLPEPLRGVWDQFRARYHVPS